MEYCVSILEDILDRPRNPIGGEFTQWYKDIAYAAQCILEEIVLSLVEEYTNILDCNNICLSGGVALNCKVNKAIIDHESVNSVFIQPVANDAGLSLGAAMNEFAPENFADFDTVYLGTDYSDEYVERLMKDLKLSYRKSANVAREAAELLAHGDIIGWFQGRSEMGPRALGNRSILADPRTEKSRARVNKQIKHREEWRPFAPSFLAEEVAEHLKTASEYPFMVRTSDVCPETADEIVAVIHQGDQTTRPQTIRQDQNPLYHQLISEFKSITGVPAVLNTSFNNHGEPIVNSPREAIRDFFSMGLDALFLHSYIIEK